MRVKHGRPQPLCWPAGIVCNQDILTAAQAGSLLRHGWPETSAGLSTAGTSCEAHRHVVHSRCEYLPQVAAWLHAPQHLLTARRPLQRPHPHSVKASLQISCAATASMQLSRKTTDTTKTQGKRLPKLYPLTTYKQKQAHSPHLARGLRTAGAAEHIAWAAAAGSVHPAQLPRLQHKLLRRNRCAGVCVRRRSRHGCAIAAAAWPKVEHGVLLRRSVAQHCGLAGAGAPPASSPPAVLLLQALCLRLCQQWKAVRSQVCAVASQSQAARRRMAGRPPRHHCTSLPHCSTASNASTPVLLSVLKQAMCRLGSLNTVQNYFICTK